MMPWFNLILRDLEIGVPSWGESFAWPPFLSC